MTTLEMAAAAALLTAGYAVGRYRPARRASDWANWQRYDRSVRRHGARWWVRWTVLSAENIGWLIAHPIQGWHAWKHRNDPPPPRSPAPKIRHIGPQIPDHHVNEEA